MLSRSKITAAILAAALLLTGCGSQKPAEAHTTGLFAMDTYMELKVWCPDGELVLQTASDRISELESTFSVTIPDSDISRLNHANGQPVEVSADTAKVIEKGIEMGDASGGALDISLYPVLQAWGFTAEEKHVPPKETIQALLQNVDYTKIRAEGQTITLPQDMQIDLGALAKGYTSDEVIQIFRENGAESAIVSLGGNVQTLGRKPDGSQWRVGIVNPFVPSENLGVLDIEDRAVITSGNYERYFEENGVRYWHILDRADGQPADNGLVSVTVVGSSGLECDALSTALFVEGTERAAAHWRRDGGFDMLLVTDDGRLLLTEGLESAFTNQSAMPVEVIRHA
ncbi:MAG: FAD:protein FMN transferase [Oscillospiraceae bacterium]|nr:FAD:protein FMN transferase [Oscillospiraceae bacterium]